MSTPSITSIRETLLIAPKLYQDKFPSFTPVQFAELLSSIRLRRDSVDQTPSFLKIAKAFNFTKSIQIFELVGQLEGVRGFITPALQDYIKTEEHVMFSNIEYFYGLDVRTQLEKCL